MLDLAAAELAFHKGDHALSGEILNGILASDPDNVAALRRMVLLLADAGKHGIALAAAEKLDRLDPGAVSLGMLGAVYASLQMPDRAIEALESAIAMHDAIEHRLALSAAYAMAHRFDDALALALSCLRDGEYTQAHVTAAIAYFHRREWASAWDHFRYGMGRSAWRDYHDYGLPAWDGQPGRLLVYAEQGLGDQIAYCSSIPDANRVVQLVTHPKLASLMERSLGIEVYGDQFKSQLDWSPEADYQCSMSEMQRFTRRSQEDFPRTPYLIPHPEKSLQWAALMGRKPRIGIAWTGGMLGSSGFRNRSLSLTDLLPILKMDAQFVSLEYRDDESEVENLAATHGLHVDRWPWGTATDNYDDTAALVANLDAVVCVPTTVYHLAGALGVRAYVLVHDTPHWHEGLYDRTSPWWASVSFTRRSNLGVHKAVEMVADEMQRDRPGRAWAWGTCQ